MACSPFIALALKRNGLGILLTGAATFGGILVLGLLLVSFGVQKHEKDVPAASTPSSAIGQGVTFSLAVMFFIFVSVGNGIGIWSAEYAKRLPIRITRLNTP